MPGERVHDLKARGGMGDLGLACIRAIDERDRLARELAKAIRERDEARRMLNKVQWVEALDGVIECPWCGCSQEHGHAESCELAKAAAIGVKG